MTRLLLERGADFNIKDKTGRTPLDVACDKQHQGPFWALTEFGAGHATALDPGNLPEWVFTSDALIREPEKLISTLEIMILNNSALSEHKEPGYCVDCEKLRKESIEAFQQKDDNVARWRGNRSFDTSGELDTRGWCFQEQLLSPRILSYADSELFWDCTTTQASESWPGGIFRPVRTFE